MPTQADLIFDWLQKVGSGIRELPPLTAEMKKLLLGYLTGSQASPWTGAGLRKNPYWNDVVRKIFAAQPTDIAQEGAEPVAREPLPDWIYDVLKRSSGLPVKDVRGRTIGHEGGGKPMDVINAIFAAGGQGGGIQPKDRYLGFPGGRQVVGNPEDVAKQWRDYLYGQQVGLPVSSYLDEGVAEARAGRPGLKPFDPTQWKEWTPEQRDLATMTEASGR